MTAGQESQAAPPAPSRWTSHEATSADDEQVLGLFEEVFGYPMSLEHWRWKYAEAPMRGTLLRRAGRPVAYYGGMPRAVQGPQGLHRGVQHGDVMVHPSERGAFTRRGAFYEVAQAFRMNHIGPQATYEFAYGFPNLRHFSLAAKLDLQIQGDRMQQLRWAPLAASREPWLLREAPLDASGLGVVDRLWQAMKRDWDGFYIPVRDAARWSMRFLQRPGVRYDLLLVRRRLGGRPLGAAVVREHEQFVEWLDFVGGRGAIAPVLHAVRRFAASRGGKPVVGMWSACVAHEFQLAGAQPEAGDNIVVPLWTAKPGDAQPYPWQDKLWLMGGDSDFL